MIEPAKSVSKKYWKYASKFPDRQLYTVFWTDRYGVIFRCVDCGREINALERHRRLCFREPRTMFARKVCVSLCKDCDTKLKTTRTTEKVPEVEHDATNDIPKFLEDREELGTDFQRNEPID